MKKSWAGVVAAGVFLTGAGTAAAAAWHELPEMTVQGVYFYEGRYKFNPPGQNHGAFEWAGYLHDAVARDGHNVYMQVRVEGHGAVRYYGKQGRTVSLHKSNWDGAQQYTDDAYIRACVDRGAAQSDLCTAELHYKKN
ncbi:MULTISPECIES: hypothetical protein [Streptomyces]|uniref:Uncharacterized protein n=2 Tax=Streptomyces TaxID=1883 RepID=A0ABU3UUL7_9ACTN|nr:MULTISPECIES: hypothetical protein [Streptomyces]MDU8997523.1 hypothetical protein [Streptomyces mirabilis]QDN77926.1 hypothetical protein FNV64_22010 [Streptomyces sp. S1A1-7]QDN87603.1 hypothetical protein FNV61_19965 [Streptomyces sp. RLB3-6]QDO08424.1 hypothetical protein FNV68_21050 [Streptomyces sp. S1D4-23]